MSRTNPTKKRAAEGMVRCKQYKPVFEATGEKYSPVKMYVSMDKVEALDKQGELDTTDNTVISMLSIDPPFYMGTMFISKKKLRVGFDPFVMWKGKGNVVTKEDYKAFQEWYKSRRGCYSIYL